MGDSENAKLYTDSLVEFVKQNEGFSEVAYNNGKTIGYGFDFYLYPDITINYNEDGSITEVEAERLLRIMLDQSKDNLNKFLDNNNLQVDQNTYDALTDLFYNRNSNDLTKEVNCDGIKG